MPLLWILAAAAGGLIVVDRFALATVRPPRKPMERSARDLGRPHERLEFPSFDGVTLRGEWIEPPGADPGAATHVLVHGWTGNSGTMLHVAEPLLAAGFPVFTFDVRRHGLSDDGPHVTIRHFRDDLRHAVRAVADRRPGAPIIVVGHSLGGSAALLAAELEPAVGAVALIAAPANLFEVTAGTFSDRGLPGEWITRLLTPFWQRRAGVPFDSLDPVAAAGRLGIPILVTQGDLDTRVTGDHAERIARGAGVPIRWVRGAGHKDILGHPELHRALIDFAARVPSGPEPVPVDVLAAVIRDGDRYLVGRRASGKRHGGLWEFPGGKVKPGESWRDAAARELREELELQLVELGTPAFTSRDPETPFLIHFVPAVVDGTPRAVEHDEIRWVHPDELASLALAPADRAFADRWIRDVRTDRTPGAPTSGA